MRPIDPRLPFCFLLLLFLGLFACDQEQPAGPVSDDDDSAGTDDDDDLPADPGPSGFYSGEIAGAVRATISGEPWEAVCFGQASVAVDAVGQATGTFFCSAAELTLPVEGFFANTGVPGSSAAQLQVGEATVSLQWAEVNGVPAVRLGVDGSMPGPTGSDLSATIEIEGVLPLE